MSSLIHIGKVGFLHPDVNELDENLHGNEKATLYIMTSKYKIVAAVVPSDEWSRKTIYEAIRLREWLIASVGEVEVFLGSNWIGATDLTSLLSNGDTSESRHSP